MSSWLLTCGSDHFVHQVASVVQPTIEDGQLDVIAAYSTDGELTRYDLVLLEDDLEYFPKYFAAYLTHDRLPAEVLEVL